MCEVTIVRNEQGRNSIATVVLRGSTDSIPDDLERAVDHGVITYKAMCKDGRIVPGAAATEIELARRLKEFSFKETGDCWKTQMMERNPPKKMGGDHDDWLFQFPTSDCSFEA